MDEKIEELVMKANAKKYYQIFLIAVGFLIYVTTNIISSDYGNFTNEPTVNYIDHGVNKTDQLTQQICNIDPNYTIVQNETSSWYYTFGDYCNASVNFINPFIGNFGSLLGVMILPFLIQFLGEKNTVLLTGYGYSLVAAGNIFMPNWAGALAFSFLNNFTGTAMEIAFFMGVSENCPGKMRSIALNILGAGYPVASLGFGLLFQNLQGWKIPFIISAVSNLLLTAAIHIFMYENPRIFLKNGKVDMFVQTLKKIAKFNRCNKEFDPIANKILNEYDEEKSVERSGGKVDEMNRSLLEKFKEFVLTQEETSKKYNIIHVLKYRSHRNIFLLMCLISFLNSGMYQSISLSTNQFGNNQLNVNNISSAIQIVLTVASGFTMNIRFLKRKGNMYITIILSAVLMIVLMVANVKTFIKEVLIVALINIFSYSGQVLGAYNTEVYSTKLLNTAFSWNNNFGTAGSMAFPAFVTYMDRFDYYLMYTILCGVMCVILFFLPETYGKPQLNEIPEEIEERLIDSNSKKLID